LAGRKVRGKVKGGRGIMCAGADEKRKMGPYRRGVRALRLGPRAVQKLSWKGPEEPGPAPSLVLAMGALGGGSFGPGRSPGQDR